MGVNLERDRVKLRSIEHFGSSAIWMRVDEGYSYEHG